MKKLFVVLAAMLLLVTMACSSGGGDSASSSQASVNTTGTWKGSYNSTVFGAETMTLNIQQNGTVLTGTYSSSTGATGSISGSVNGNNASFTIIVTTSGCSGSFSGTAIIDIQSNPETMSSFQFNGSSTCGGSESGTGNLEKQFTARISGTVSGDVQSGVTITLSDDTSTTTDSNGDYIFSNVANGDYTVTPSLAGYTFFPISTAVTVNGADNPNTNFTATANTASTYSISGTVSGAVQSGVTITLTGTSSGSTLTDSSGNYSFSDIDNGNYTITASKTGYTFSPVFSITVNGANITGQNFTATANVVPSSAKAITAFSIGLSVGAINEAEKTIAVIVPFGTDVTALVATFTITGESVYVNLVEQTTGQTLNDFTHPVVYTVKAADASTTTYTVSVTLNRLATAVTVSMTPNSPPAHAGIFCTATGSITGSYTVTGPVGGSVIVTEWYDEYGGVSVLRQTNTTTLPSGVTSGTDTLPGKFLYHHIITFKVTADGVVSDSTSAKIL